MLRNPNSMGFLSFSFCAAFILFTEEEKAAKQTHAVYAAKAPVAGSKASVPAA